MTAPRTCCIVWRWAGRDDGGAAVGSRRRAGRPAREARRFSARLSRRYDPSVDARGDGRARDTRIVSAASASRGDDALRQCRRHARSRSPISRTCRRAASSWRSCRSGTFSTFWPKKRARFPNFDLRMQTRASDLLWEGRSRRRACARKPRRARSRFAPTSRSPPTVANRCIASQRRPRRRWSSERRWTCSGCGSTKHADDPHETFGYIRGGRIMALIDRGAYWQCAYVIPKGTLAELRARGLEEFRSEIAAIVPFLHDRVARTRELGRRQAADRARQSPAAMVSARAALHRRCRARDVADRRRRHQPGDSRCGRGGEHARAENSRGGVTVDDLRAVQRRREPAARSHAGAAALHSAQDHRSRPRTTGVRRCCAGCRG